MLIKKSESKRKENSKDCTIWEYECPSKDLSFATALINERYPKEGRLRNLKCEEIYYVISGSGIIHSEEGNFKIEKGDIYFFKKQEKYWVEGKDLFLVVVNSPKWSVKQYENID